MKVVVHNGKQLYQWDQTANQVFIEIVAPPPNSSVFCNITENYVQLGANLPGLPTTWFLNHDTWDPVNKDESYFKSGKETCKIVLTKANPGVHWRYALIDDRDDTRRDQQKPKAPAPPLRPTQSKGQGSIPVVSQRQRVPPANSRSPSPRRRNSSLVKQDPPSPRSSIPKGTPLGLTRKPQQKQQGQQQNTTSRSPSPGRRKARPAASKASPPERAKSTSSLLSPLKSTGKPAARDPSPGKRKFAVAKENNRTPPVKAKSTSFLLSPNKGQHQRETTATESQSPTNPSANKGSTDPQHQKLSRSLSPGRRRAPSGKENIPSSEKEIPRRSSFLDRFKASKEAQQQKEPKSAMASQAQGKSDTPVKAQKLSVSFQSPPKDSSKGQHENESKTSRPSSPGKGEPTNPDSWRYAKPSSAHTPLAVMQQRQHNEKEKQLPKVDKSLQKEAQSSKGAPANSEQPHEKPQAKPNEASAKSSNVTGPITRQPTEIKSIGRGQPRTPSTAEQRPVEKQISPIKFVYMEKLIMEKEEQLKLREEEVQKLNRKISKLEDVIATSQRQDQRRQRQDRDVADGLQDQLRQSKSEHQHELSRLEISNRHLSAKLDKQTALVQRMEEELDKNETKMEKQRGLAQSQARELKDRESWIESLQSQLQKSKKRGNLHEQDQIMAELQKQIHRVKVVKKGMKEYKRRWKEQRRFSDMQTRQIREKQSSVESLTAKLELANRRIRELESELKRDLADIIGSTNTVTESHKQLEKLQREHKQALEKIHNLESELQRQWEDWNEMEENMAEAQAQLAWLSGNHDYSDEYRESWAKMAIRELIESRPDGGAQHRIKQLESELEGHQKDWRELEEVLDLAHTKVVWMERQMSSKKLSDYIIPDIPRVSINEPLDRMAKKMVSARSQLEESQQRRLPHSQQLAPYR